MRGGRTFRVLLADELFIPKTRHVCGILVLLQCALRDNSQAPPSHLNADG